jgi:predicted double-glycine peptidase
MRLPKKLIIACGFFGLIPAWGLRAEPVRSLLEIRQENVVLQEWDLSCGAAALATLLRYQHGDDVSEREVALGLVQREEYITNPNLLRLRQGFSLLDLKRYAVARGYNGIGMGRMKLDDLVAKAPVIVPVNFLGYNHFVIFRGILGNTVLVADPAYGNRTLTLGRFEAAWIDYPEIGRVGFVVARRDGRGGPGALRPRHVEFLTLQ